MANPSLVFIVGAKDDTGAVLAGVTAHMDKMKTQAHDTGSAFEGMGNIIRTSLGVAGLTLGVGAIVDQLKGVVTSALEFGEAIQRASQKTGLAAGTLSTLHYAATVTGGDFDSMTSAVAKMDKTIGQATEGNKPAEAFMKALGLNAKDLANRSDGAEVAFHKFASTLASTENPIRRVELATSLLGKAGASQIPMLIDVGNHWDEWKQKAMDAGVYLDGAGLDALVNTNQKLNDMKEHLTGAGVAFTEGFTSGLMQMLSVISGGKSTMQTMENFGGLVSKSLALAGTEIFGVVSDFELLAVAILKVLEVSALLSGDLSDSKFYGKLADGAKADADMYGQKALGMWRVVSPQGGIGSAAYQTGLGQGPSDPMLDAIRARDASGAFKGITPPEGRGGGKGGKKSKAKAEDEDRIPIDYTAVEAERAAARRTHQQIEDLKKSMSDAGPVADLTDNGAAMAAWEKQKEQADALQALYARGDVLKRESGIAEAQIQQKVLAGTMSQVDAAEQLDAIRAGEITQLQDIAARYLAMGDAGRTAYADVEDQITRTMEQTEKQSKATSYAMESMAHSVVDPLIEGAGTVEQRWMQVGQNIRRELESAMSKEVVSMLTGGGDDGKGPGKSSAGQGGAGIVGGLMSKVGGLFHLGGGAAAVRGAVAAPGGAGGAPVVQIINQTSQPAQGTATSRGGGDLTGMLTPHVVEIVLSDLERGGTIAQALGGGMGMLA